MWRARREAVLFSNIAAAILLSSFTLWRGSPLRPGEIPFQFRDGLIWIQVAVPQSANRLSFLLDSGANVSVLDLRVAKQLGLKLGRLVEVRGVSVQTFGSWPVSLPGTAAAVPLPENLLALDLGRLSRSCTCSVDGLLGADFFIGRVVQIDFEREIIRLLREAPTPAGGDTLPLEVRRGVFRVPVGVNKAALQWARLDSGCASGLEWVLADQPASIDSFKISIGLAETRIPQALMNVRLGNQVHEVLVGVHERELFPAEHGLLGNGLLSRFGRVTVDEPGHHLILEPRSAPGRLN